MAITGGPQGEILLNLLFYKIHYGAVFLEKDKYLSPAQNLRRTRASHESQYTRYIAYNDALKNSFFPRTFRLGIVSLPRWSHPRPLNALVWVQAYVFSMPLMLLVNTEFK